VLRSATTNARIPPPKNLVTSKLETELRREGKLLTKTNGVNIDVSGTLVNLNPFSAKRREFVDTLSSGKKIYKPIIKATETIAPNVMAVLRILAESNAEGKVIEALKKGKEEAKNKTRKATRRSIRNMRSGVLFSTRRRSPRTTTTAAKTGDARDVAVVTSLASLLFSKSSRSNNLPSLHSVSMFQAGCPKALYDVNNKLKSTSSVILPERRSNLRYLKFCCVIVSKSGLKSLLETMLCASSITITQKAVAAYTE
jgi:hypothetical protein